MRRFSLWRLLTVFSLVVGGVVFYITRYGILRCSKSPESCVYSAKTDPQTVKELQRSLSTAEPSRNITTPPKTKRDDAEVFLLLLIMSAPYKTERRVALRRTWLTTLTNNSVRLHSLKNTHTVKDPVNPTNHLVIHYEFVCGHYNDLLHRVEPAITNEIQVYGDILRLEYNETYAKLVYKTLQALTFAASVNTRFVVKMDDDVYLNVPRLVWWLRTANLPEKLYAGYCLSTSRIIRKKESKYYVSYEILNGTYFPEYCMGPFYMFSKNVVFEILNASKVIRPFSVEDAYIGMLAKSIGVTPTQLNDYAVLVEPKLSFVETSWNDSQLMKYFVLGHNIPIERLFAIHERYRSLKTTYIS